MPATTNVSVRRFLTLFVLLALLCGVLVFQDIVKSETQLPRELLQLATLALAVSVVGSIVRILIIGNYRRRLKLEPGEKDNFVLGIDAAANVFVLLVTLGGIFPIFGVPFLQFLTSLSLFSVALAWLFKEYLNNFFDSFRLMFSTDFLLGDYIKINDTTKGYISDITFRATKVKTDEGDILYIPNTTMMNNEITNYSKVKLKRIIVPFSLSTTRLRSAPDLEHHLTEVVRATAPEAADTVRVFLRITGVTPDAASLQLEISIDRYSFAVETALHRAVYEAVLAWDR